MPDFIIGGAMKAGTSTLHAILGSHPGVFIPRYEMAFFDFDDIDEHPYFAIWNGNRWTTIDFDRHLERLLNWYRSQFAAAQTGQMVGEDATGYLTSTRAPERILQFLPHVKLIFLLRDPADRTYSHYWHMLRTGREYYTFEHSLMITPETKFRRSRYLTALKRYFQLFPRNQVFVETFERFITNMEEVTAEILAFLGLEPMPLSALGGKPHRNPTKLSRSLFLRRWENRLFRLHASRLYATDKPPGQTPHSLFADPYTLKGLPRLAKAAFRFLNPQNVKRPPPMQTLTRAFLNDEFFKSNADINVLVGKQIDSTWYLPK